MDLRVVWFILIAVLYTGYFILEGFDLGVGVLLPFLAKNDKQKRVIINTIGPHWDGNEVWLITAGGATFAAFPLWYATLFSGFYLPLFLMLVTLIIRGVAFEFRSKEEHPIWRATWDWAIFVGSLIPLLLWGVAFANIIRGVPIDSSLNYAGGFWNLLNGFALLCGITTVIGLTLHGALFLNLKTDGEIRERAQLTITRLWLAVVVLFIACGILGIFETDIYQSGGVVNIILVGLALISLIAVGILNRMKRNGWAFIASTLFILLTISTIFTGLFPRLMIAELAENSLTIYNASSGNLTLQVMTIVALVLVPIVLLYQGWSYWIFRKRISENHKNLEY